MHEKSILPQNMQKKLWGIYEDRFLEKISVRLILRHLILRKTGGLLYSALLLINIGIGIIKCQLDSHAGCSVFDVTHFSRLIVQGLSELETYSGQTLAVSLGPCFQYKLMLRGALPPLFQSSSLVIEAFRFQRFFPP